MYLYVKDPYIVNMIRELKKAIGGTTDDAIKLLLGWEPRIYLKAPEPPGDEFPVHYVRVYASKGKKNLWFDTSIGKSLAFIKWLEKGNHWNLTLTSIYGTGRLRAVEYEGELYVIDSRLLIPPLRVEAYAKFTDWMMRRLLNMADDLCSRLGCRAILVEPEFLNQYPVIELFTRRTGSEKT